MIENDRKVADIVDRCFLGYNDVFSPLRFPVFCYGVISMMISMTTLLYVLYTTFTILENTRLTFLA